MLALHRNENGYGLSPLLRALVERAHDAIGCFPHDEVPQLCRMLARYFHLPPEQVVCAAGSTEILCRSLLQLATIPNIRLLYFSPASMALAQFKLEGMPRMPLALDAALSADLAGLRLKREQHRGPAVVYLSQPNCYTGELINRERLYDWIAAAGDATYFVLDEAYMEFVPDSRQHSLTEMLAGCTHKLLVLRTFSKAYGLAGLRVGYGLMSNGWLQHPTKLDSLCTLSVFGVRAALEAFEDKQWLMHSMQLLEVSRVLLLEGLAALQLACYSGPVNFVLHALPGDAERFLSHLYNYGVRVLLPEGLDGWCRVTVGRPSEVSYYLDVLRRF